MKRSRLILGTVLALLLIAGASIVVSRPDSSGGGDAAAPGAARSGPASPAVKVTRTATKHDTSAPLRSIKPLKEQSREAREEEQKDKGEEGREGLERDEVLPHPKGGGKDPVAQVSQSVSAAAPAVGAGFDTVGNGWTGPQGTFTVNSAPPDINSDVSKTQVFTVVNTSFSIQTKTGTGVYGPAAGNTLFSGFGGACQTTNDGDPVIRYDRLADRWVFTQFANASSSTGPYLECVAVSTTSDPLGTWNRYSYSFTGFPDYPKLSVWPDAYYVTYNIFNGNNFGGATSCAMDRTKMLAGQPATQQCFSTSTTYGGLLASDVDGTTPPALGAPNVNVALGATSSTLATWKFHVDWATPANSTFTGPTAMTVASYTPACNGGICIAQPGTSVMLDSLADRIMFRAAYRNFGDHESLLITHAVNTGTAIGVRWYEIRLPAGTPTLFQQGTYAPDTTSRWMSSAAMDKAGNIGLGYTAGSGTLAPSMRFTGRLAGDAAGVMTQGETNVITSGGSQTGNLTRWGDYSSMNVDPSDDCTFWYSSEYLPASGSFNWRTRIASFTLPGCLGAVADDFSLSTTPTSGTVTQGTSTNVTVNTGTVGNAQTVALSASGLPSGATAMFAPTSVTSGGSSTLTLATAADTPAGTYPITITGTGTSGTHTTSYSLTVSAVIVGGVTNGGFEAGNLSGWTATGTNSASTTSPRTGTYDGLSGTTTATIGDSKLVQTFTDPTGTTRVNVAYRMQCGGKVNSDWATITLRNNTTGTTTTLLSKTCKKQTAYTLLSATITPGTSYTLTLLNHDDGAATTPTYTRWDDITLS